MCRNGTWSLFLAYDTKAKEVVGSALGEISQEDDHLTAAVFSLGGTRLIEWAFLMWDIEEWARLSGAQFMELEGSGRGYLRLFPDYTEYGEALRRRL